MVFKVLSWVMWAVASRGKPRQVLQSGSSRGVTEYREQGLCGYVCTEHSLCRSLSCYVDIVLKLESQPKALFMLSRPSTLLTSKSHMYFHVPGTILGTWGRR